MSDSSPQDYGRMGVVTPDVGYDYTALGERLKDTRCWFLRARGEWETFCPVAVCIDMTTTIDPNKYLTINREEAKKAFADKGILFPGLIETLELEDAVVIRRGDVFAQSALYAYASTIQSVIEVLEIRAEAMDEQDSYIERLRALADYFAGEADASRQVHGHLPIDV